MPSMNLQSEHSYFLAGLCDDKTLKRSNTFLRLRPSSRTSSRVSPESSPKSPKSSNHRNYNGKKFFPLFLVENFVILNQPKIHELKKFRMLTFSLGVARLAIFRFSVRFGFQISVSVRFGFQTESWARFSVSKCRFSVNRFIY